MKRQRIARLCATAVALFSTFAFSNLSFAQTVTWGVNGAGGNGTWDTTTADWSNGTTNVPWPSSGNAIFAGASGGTVNVTGSPVVSSMTFNTPGYTLQGGTIQSGPSGLTLTTNIAATISSNLSSSASTGNTLIKNGPGALSLTGTDSLGTLQVNQGAVNVSGLGNLFSADVNLANAPGVTVSLASTFPSIDMHSLSGGGALGGVVQPLNQTGQITLLLGGTGNFGGVLGDNGGGVLALEISNITANQTLQGTNAYSGPTSLAAGTLALAGNGSLLNSTISTAVNGALILDNSAAALANRLSDSAPVTMNGGSIQLVGNSTTPVNELAGALNISSANAITVTPSGSTAAQLSFAGFTRNNHATVSVVGPGVSFPGVANGSTGIVAPYITAGNEWAMIGGDGRIAPYTAYATDLNTGSASDNVKLTASDTTLTNSTIRSSLNLQNGNASMGQVLDLAGKSLSLTAGGILSSGAGNATITGGNLATTAQELVVTSNNNLTIGANIGDGGSATTLTKSGPGVLTLSGNNSYTGTTAITQGTLVVSSDANLGHGSTIELASDTTLQAGASFSSTKGLTTTTGFSVGGQGAVVDTAGFNVAFSGPSSGTLQKNGDGTLTLSNGTIGNMTLNGGTLVLPNATSGQVNISQGTLQAAGTLSSITWSINPVTLDIGGASAATLTTGQILNGFPGTALRVDFGIGATSSDMWDTSGSSLLPFSSLLSAGSLQFEFQNLGGLKTGIDYPVITLAATPFLPNANIFAFAPDMAAKGWSGTFDVTSTGVFVRFSSVPEPSGFCLIALGIAVIAARRRRS